MAKKILIADDEISIQRLIEYVLRKFEYEILIANNGNEAVEIAMDERPDLIFLDVMMPEKNGIEVCREIKSNPDLRDTYIVMLTALGEESDIRKIFEAGADEYVAKPFSPSKISELVKKVLDRR
jgi:DNA-binding response OmpR family regulator